MSNVTDTYLKDPKFLTVNLFMKNTTFDAVSIDKLDRCCYSGRRMKTEGYWVEMACPLAQMLLAL